MEMDVVMHFSKKDGTKTEVHVNLASDPHEVARAYCIEHKMKLSLVPALAAIIRKRKEEALRRYELEQQAELDAFTPTQSQKSPPPKPQRPSSGTRGTAGLESPPSSGPSSPVSCPSSPNGANPFDMFPVDDTAAAAAAAPAGFNPFDQIIDSPTTEETEDAFAGFSRGRSTDKRQSSGIRQLKIQTEWGGMTPTPSPSSSSSSAAAGGGPSARSSSVPATTSSSLQFRRSSIGPASPAATAATAGTSNFEDRDMSQDLGKTHHYLVGHHNYSPRQDDGYMPKMRGPQSVAAAAHRRSMSLSPPPPIKNQSSVDRLYSEHERMQARLRRLSMSVEDMKKAEISSTSFRNAVGFIASSPSVKVIQHSGKKEGQSHQEWLYYSGLKWTAIKDRQTQERARELEKQRDDHFRANATFHPQLSPSPLFSSSRAGGTQNKSVFEALYNSRTYYSDRVETLKKIASEEASKELIFSPMLENRQLTEKLAKKWREKEDLDQAKRRRRDNEQQQSSNVGTGQANDDLLTLADLAQTSNPFDAILLHTDGDQPLQENIVTASTSASSVAATLLASTVEDTAPPPDHNAAHLSFFDSFIQQGDSPNVIVDTMGLEDIFSLQDLVIPIKKESRNGNGRRSSDALFNRLHCHSSTKALEQAKKKHQPVFSHKPDIGKSSSTHAFISVEDDEEKFFARLSRVYKKAEPPKKAPEKKIDSKSEANLVERMTVQYPKRSEKLRAQANSVHKKELEEAPNTVFTKPRSENLAKKVRRESLRVIFNLLLATVDYAREVEATKLDEGEGSWSVRKSAADDPVVGDGMLDTRRAISSLLHPKSLVRAIDMVLNKARPNPLSFDKFVLEIEALIFSGKCEPISAHLSAPDRSSWSENWHCGREVEEPMHKPTLRARNVTEMMAKKRCRASRIDPRDCESSPHFCFQSFLPFTHPHPFHFINRAHRRNPARKENLRAAVEVSGGRDTRADL